ncbi:Meiotic nuclear division protein 1, partial [Clydaea vesicula]
KDFFQLKDIEKIASKEKGVTLNTVKDILDGLSNYFWNFPSTAYQQKKRLLDESNVEKNKLNLLIKNLTDEYEIHIQGREKSDEREIKL